MCGESRTHGEGLPKSLLRIGGNGPDCNIRLLFITDNGTERQPLVFVPTDNNIGDSGNITVSIASDFYLDAELSGETTVGAWCVDSQTFIFLNQVDNYQVFDPCEDNWYVDVIPENREGHYGEINWQIISYIINQYEVDDDIQCPNDETIQVTRDGIQLAIWYFTNPDDTQPTCPVEGEDSVDPCGSGCAIIAEVEAVFGI